ncbi:hypothetical protein [Streptomyces sp. NPDC006739]
MTIRSTVSATASAGMTGRPCSECWFIQAGREPEPFRFRNVPGPATPAGA